MANWRCKVCGYIHSGEDAPDVCPVCGVQKAKFERISEDRVEEKSKEETDVPKMEWKCSNCGYAYSGSLPPEICPGCNQKCIFMDVTCYIPECRDTGRDFRI